MVDLYIDKYKKAVKGAKNDKEIETVLNKIYEDGFEDGVNEN